jgi:hypothetical protein
MVSIHSHGFPSIPAEFCHKIHHSRDRFKKFLQQRRQVLLGCVGYLVKAEALENEALRGEDHEDPPM